MALCATGTTMTIDGWTVDLLRLSGPGWERGSVNTSKMATETSQTSVPEDLKDPGAWDIVIEYDVDEAPPINNDPGTVAVVFPGGHTWSSDGYLIDFSIDAATEQRITASARVKLTGTMSIT